MLCSSLETTYLTSATEEKTRAKLVDAHVHLEEIEGLESALRRAKEAGVKAIIGVSSDLPSCNFALEIAKKHPNFVYPALGVHPWNSSITTQEINEVVGVIESNIGRVVAIGEIGLDFWYKEAKKEEGRERQRKIFIKFLELAAEHNKPVIIHSRGAWENCFFIIKEMGIERAIFHWYSGPLEVLTKILEAGYFISATPAVEYSKEHQAAIRYAPLECIVLETDSPVSYREKKAEPADILKTLAGVAKIKEIDEEAVAEQTTENAHKIFGIG